MLLVRKRWLYIYSPIAYSWSVQSSGRMSRMLDIHRWRVLSGSVVVVSTDDCCFDLRDQCSLVYEFSVFGARLRSNLQVVGFHTAKSNYHSRVAVPLQAPV